MKNPAYEQIRSRKVKGRLRMLQHAEHVSGNVSQTCRFLGVSEAFSKSRNSATGPIASGIAFLLKSFRSSSGAVRSAAMERFEPACIFSGTITPMSHQQPSLKSFVAITSAGSR